MNWALVTATAQACALAVVAGAGGGAGLGWSLLWHVKPYVRNRLTSERAAFVRNDLKTWRAVTPALVGVQVGSLAHVAGEVQAAVPAGLTYTFRTRETNDLDIGTVRVSLEVGNGNHYHNTEEP